MRVSNTTALALANGVLWFWATTGPACSPAESAPPLGAGGQTTTSAGGDSNEGGNGGTGGAGGGSGITIQLPDASVTQAEVGASAAIWPPPDYVNITETSYGAYGLGPLVSPENQGPSPGAPSGRCSGLFGVVRDFKMGNLTGGHPDFQKPSPMEDKGIVADTLGDDGKPVYATPDGKTRTTSGQANFDQWYRDVEGVNMTYMLGLQFVESSPGVMTFAASLDNTDAKIPNSSFFPLDGQGYKDEAAGSDRKTQHNFAFTTEIHTTFTYNGGEVFKFQGDDDVFVFINKHLAIDLGGIHEQETLTVDLDQQAESLGIEKGKIYDLAVFNAERHTTQSNFRIDTTMVFEDCGVIY